MCCVGYTGSSQVSFGDVKPPRKKKTQSALGSGVVGESLRNTSFCGTDADIMP